MPRCVSSVRFIHCSRAGRGQGLIKQLHLTLLNNAQLLLITQQANWQQNESSSNSYVQAQQPPDNIDGGSKHKHVQLPTVSEDASEQNVN